MTGGVSATPVSPAKADIGLGNVDNTSDVNKPVSTAQAAADALAAIPAKTEQLTTQFLLTAPQPQVIPAASFTVGLGTSTAGKFVAQAAKAIVELQVLGASLYGFPMTMVPFSLFWGDDAVVAAGQMLPKAQADALGTGVAKVSMGIMQAQHTNLVARAVLTGLTVGHTYRFEIAPSIVGGFERLYGASDTHTAVGCSKAISPIPDYAFAVVTRSSEAFASVFAIGHGFNGTRDVYLGRVALPANANFAGRVAVTPDGTKAVITNQYAAITSPNTGQVTVINTGLQPATKAGLTAVAPTLLANYSLATDDQLLPVAIEPTGVYCYVGVTVGTHAGKLAKVKLSDGTTTYSGLLGAASTSTPNDIAIDGTGTYAYVALFSEGKVVKVRLSDMAVVATVSGLTSIVSCSVNPVDNATVLATGGTNPNGRIWHLASSATVDATLALSATVTPGAGTFSSTLLPGRVAWHADGLGAMIANGNAAVSMSQVYHYIPANQRAYTQWTSAADLNGTATNPIYDIAVSPYGDIFTPNSTNKAVECWPGGRLALKEPASDFGAGDLRVAVHGGV